MKLELCTFQCQVDYENAEVCACCWKVAKGYLDYVYVFDIDITRM